MNVKLSVKSVGFLYILTGLAVFFIFTIPFKLTFLKNAAAYIDTVELCLFRSIRENIYSVCNIKDPLDIKLDAFLNSKKQTFDLYDLTDSGAVNSKIDTILKNNTISHAYSFEKKINIKNCVRHFYDDNGTLKLSHIEIKNPPRDDFLLLLKITDFIPIDYPNQAEIVAANPIYYRKPEIGLDDNRNIKIMYSYVKVFDTKDLTANGFDKYSLDLIKIRIDKINSDFWLDVDKWRGRISRNNRKIASNILDYAKKSKLPDKIKWQIGTVFSVDENIINIEFYINELIHVLDSAGFKKQTDKLKRICANIYIVDCHYDNSSDITHSAYSFLYGSKPPIDEKIFISKDYYVPSLLSLLLSEYYRVDIPGECLSSSDGFCNITKCAGFPFFCKHKSDTALLFREIVKNREYHYIDLYLYYLILSVLVFSCCFFYMCNSVRCRVVFFLLFFIYFIAAFGAISFYGCIVYFGRSFLCIVCLYFLLVLTKKICNCKRN